MAFSTQKDFFHVPFMNEKVEFECLKECVKLKSYNSTIDDRSWALDESKQSKFLSDLVTCNTPVGEGTQSGTQGGGRSAVDGGDNLLAKHGGIQPGDSVIECATEHIAKLEEMFCIKNRLQHELDVSNARLKTANEENQTIKNIISQKYDSSHTKAFYALIQELAAAGKLSKADEKELMCIYHKMEDANKAHDILQAENSYLKRLVEKLSRRATIECIKTDPEKSVDIPYLQNQVNCLRRELILLRKYEDDKLKQQVDASRSKITDQDAENLKAIVKERNALREKCKTFKELERKVCELQKKAKEADHLSGSLSCDLDSQSKYIGEMENEMKCMQTYYEGELCKMKRNEKLLKCQLDEMKEELIRATCAAQKVECLQMEIGCLRNEIMRRDIALSDYDCQYKQLMAVVEELKSNACQNLQDTQTQTCNDTIDEVAFYASATISEIMKELDKNKSVAYGLEDDPTRTFTPEECCQEMRRLQNLVRDLMKEKGSLEGEVKDRIALTKRLSDDMRRSIPRLDHLADKVDRMDKDVADSLRATKQFGQELEESLHLMQQISDVQLQNKNLERTVSAIKERDAEEIKRRQTEEQAKIKQELEAGGKVDGKETPAGGPDGGKGAEGAGAMDDGKEAGKAGGKDEAGKPGTKDDAKGAGQAGAQDDAKDGGQAGAKDDAKDAGKPGAKDDAKDSGKPGAKDDAKGAGPAGAKDDAKSGGPAGAKDDSKDGGQAGARDDAKEPGKDGGKDDARDGGQTGRDDARTGADDAKDAARGDAARGDAARGDAARGDAGEARKDGTKGPGADGAKDGGRTSDKDGGRAGTSDETMDSETEDGGRAGGPGGRRTGDGEKAGEKGGAAGAKGGRGAGETGAGKGGASGGAAGTRSSQRGDGTGVGRAGTLGGGRRSGAAGGAASRRGGPGGKAGSPGRRMKRASGDASQLDPYEQFLLKNTTELNVKVGKNMENDLRDILDEFIRECGSCFACFAPSRQCKSRFGLLCHKVVHHGIDALTFKELVYMHRKIFIAADKILPGCLLSMIVNDYKNSEADCLKCCTCKSTLCCNNSEEMLKEKVSKLERDIERAKEHLDNLKSRPVSPQKTVRIHDNRCEKNLTYRPSNPVILPKYSSKQIKNLKAKIMRCTEFL